MLGARRSRSSGGARGRPGATTDRRWGADRGGRDGEAAAGGLAGGGGGGVGRKSTDARKKKVGGKKKENMGRGPPRTVRRIVFTPQKAEARIPPLFRAREQGPALPLEDEQPPRASTRVDSVEPLQLGGGATGQQTTATPSAPPGNPDSR
jgi:hypothetical protein